VAIGLSLDLQAVNWSSSFIWILTSSLLLVAVIGKMLSGFVLWKESTLSKFIIGTAMVPRGEVGLIFANVGLSVSAISSDVYASLIVVITLTTLLIPFVLKYIYKTFERKWIFKF
jgi:Kef-type K+ transport system membrane component KefB